MHWLRVWYGKVIVLVSWKLQPWQLITSIWPSLPFPVALEVFAHIGRMLSACRLLPSLCIYKLKFALSTNLLLQETNTLSSQSHFMKAVWLKYSFHLNMEEKAHRCCWEWCHNTNILGESQGCSSLSYFPITHMWCI